MGVIASKEGQGGSVISSPGSPAPITTSSGQEKNLLLSVSLRGPKGERGQILVKKLVSTAFAQTARSIAMVTTRPIGQRHLQLVPLSWWRSISQANRYGSVETVRG